MEKGLGDNTLPAVPPVREEPVGHDVTEGGIRQEREGEQRQREPDGASGRFQDENQAGQADRPIQRMFQSRAVAQTAAPQPEGFEDRFGLDQHVAEAEENRRNEEGFQRPAKPAGAGADRVFQEYKTQAQHGKESQLGLRRQSRIVDLSQDEDTQQDRQDAKKQCLEHVSWARFRFPCKT